jgi:GAF domain-containing protein
LVADVHAFKGHIACASSTQSELVLPVFDGHGALLAVFDLDSDQPAAFTNEDVQQMTSLLHRVFQKVL